MRRLLAIKNDYLNAIEKRLDEQLDIAKQLYMIRSTHSPMQQHAQALPDLPKKPAYPMLNQTQTDILKYNSALLDDAVRIDNEAEV